MFTPFHLLNLLLVATGCLAIWPAPQTLSTGEKVLLLDQTAAITYNDQKVCLFAIPTFATVPPTLVCGGCAPSSPADTCPVPNAKLLFFFLANPQLSYTYGYTPADGPGFESADLVQAAVSRALDAIFDQSFVPWMLRERGSTFEPSVADEHTRITTLKITQTAEDGPAVFKPQDGDVDESYTLDVSEDGQASITAVTSTGVMHALNTFVQLFYKHSSGVAWYTTLAPVSVQDAPRFPHRGIMLDVARTFFPIDDILRTIDAMCWNKMNRLHIHMTDSQSWPLEIPAMPDLALKGAYSPDQMYSPADLTRIQEYAIQRGVETIVEIDMPGHIGSVSLAYPELIVAYNQLPFSWWCAEPPCGAFKLNDTGVYEFLDRLWDDLLPRIQPYSAYFHVGGDELNRNDSKLDPGVMSNETEVLQPLLQAFVDRAHDRIRASGLVPVVWEEMITDWNMTLGTDVVVQSWLGSDATKTLTGQGHKVIDSNWNFWYLDCGRGHWMNFDDGAAFSAFYPFNDWCSPAKGWRLMYSYDPVSGLDEEAAGRVLGGEAALWTEMVDSAILDSILWPRAGAVAEVLWSGRQDSAGHNRTQMDATPRLADMRERMLARGVRAGPVHMTFCTQNDPKLCEYTV